MVCAVKDTKAEGGPSEDLLICELATKFHLRSCYAIHKVYAHAQKSSPRAGGCAYVDTNGSRHGEENRFRSWRGRLRVSHVSNGKELGSATEMVDFVGEPGGCDGGVGADGVVGVNEAAEVEVQISVGMARGARGCSWLLLGAFLGKGRLSKLRQQTYTGHDNNIYMI